MLHRIDNTTSSLPAEEAQELRRLLSGVAAGNRDDLAAAPERRCTVWLCPISAMPTMPRT